MNSDLTPERIAELLDDLIGAVQFDCHELGDDEESDETIAAIAAVKAAFAAAAEERDRLRARLHHDCKGCPGCSSNDCPDALDMLRAQRDELVAALEQCDVFLRVHAKPDNPLKAGVQAALRAAKEATDG